MKFENSEQVKQATEQYLRDIFRCRGVKLEFLRKSGGSSTWKCTASKPRKKDEENPFAHWTYFVKTQVSGANPPEFIVERWRANEMAKRHDTLSTHLGVYICNGKAADRLDINLSRLGIHVLTDQLDQSIIIEVQGYIEGRTLPDILAERCKAGFDQKIDGVIVGKICKAFQKVHSVTFSKEASDPQNVLLYDDALQGLLERFEKYIPSRIAHPIINRYDKLHLYGLGQELVDSWLHKGDRLCALHGDLRGANIIFPDTLKEGQDFAALIDFSRTPWGACGYDCGRFLTDILESYLETGDEYYKLFAEEFMVQYETLRDDRFLRSEICLGAFAMMLIKLCPSYSPIENKDVAQKLYTHCIKVFEKQKFFFP